MSEFKPSGWQAGLVVVRWDPAATEYIEATVAGPWKTDDLDILAHTIREAGRQAWVDLPVVLVGDGLTFAHWEAIEARGSAPALVQAQARPADPSLTAIGSERQARIWDTPWMPAPAGYIPVLEWSAARIGFQSRRAVTMGATIGLAPSGESATEKLVAALRPPDERFAVVFEGAHGALRQLVAKVPTGLPGRVTPSRSSRLGAALRLIWPDQRRARG